MFYTTRMTKPAKPPYRLDAESLRTLEKLEECWKVPKSKVLNRCIRIAERNASAISDRLDALDRIQAAVLEKKIEVREWAESVRAERRHKNPAPGNELSHASTEPTVP